MKIALLSAPSTLLTTAAKQTVHTQMHISAQSFKALQTLSISVTFEALDDITLLTYYFENV